MMPYNSGYPATYQQMYPQYQMPYQMPQYQQMQQVQQVSQQQAQTPSSRMTEVFPVQNEKAVLEFPSTAGTTQMFIANDDSFIAIKEMSVTGQASIVIYDKRPPKPAEQPIDFSMYVTKEELETRLASLTVPKKSGRKEVDTEQ